LLNENLMAPARRRFTQEAGVSYDADKTYAQMMRPETLNILLVIALHRGWAIC